MSTIEHLFMQIFERKNWIEDQLKQQVESYGQSLAFNLLANGRRPPSWLCTGRSDGCGFPDPKGSNGEQFTSQTLFPLLQATTPSYIHTNFFNLPVLKDDKISQSNKFTETCDLNKYTSVDHRDKELHSASNQNPDIMVESVAGVRAEFDPMSRVQFSKSRQKDLEIQFSKRKSTSDHSGEASTKAEYIGRVTRSRAASLKADSAKVSSIMNESLHLHGADGGRVTKLSSSFTDRNNCIDHVQKSPKHLNYDEGDAYKAAEHQSDILSTVNPDSLGCNHMKNVLDPQTCTTATAAGELIPDATCPAPSNSNMTCAVVAMLPESFPLVEPKKLFFDGIEESCLDENSRIPMEMENQRTASEIAHTKSAAVLSVEKMVLGDHEKAHGSSTSCAILETASQRKVDEADEVLNASTEEEGQELLEIEDSEYRAIPTSGYRSRSNSLGSPVSVTEEKQCSEGKWHPCSTHRCSNMPSHIPAQLIKEASGSPVQLINITSTDGALVFSSGTDNVLLETEDIETAVAEDSKKRSLESLVHSSAGQYMGKLMKETNIDSIQLEDAVHNDDSRLSSSGKEEVVGSKLTPGADNALAEFRDIPRNSRTSGRVSDTCESINSVLLSPNKAEKCFSTHENVGNTSNMNVEGFMVSRISKAAEASAMQTRFPYFLRNSIGLDKNIAGAEGSVHCSEKKNMLIDIDGTYAGTKDDKVKAVNHHTITPNSIEVQNAPPEARYFLRSSTSHDKQIASLMSNRSADSLKQPTETITRACEISWPKRRKVEYRSSNILATSPRLRVKHILHFEEGRSQLKNASGAETQPAPLSSEIETIIPNDFSESTLKLLQQSKNPCMPESFSNLKEHDEDTVNSSPLEHVQEDPFLDLPDGNSRIYSKDKEIVSEPMTSKTRKNCVSGDIDGSPSVGHTLEDIVPKCSSNVDEFTENRKQSDEESISLGCGKPSFSFYDDLGVDENMPEFEGFSIDVPLDMEDDIIFKDSDLSSLTGERASVLEQLCRSSNMLSPASCPSTKYKIHKVPGVYQSLPAGLLEHMNLSSYLQFKDVDIEQSTKCNDGAVASFNGSLESQFDGSFVGRPYSHSMPSSTTSWKEVRRPPLTPPMMKFGQRIVSGQSGASSEKSGSNPELICFRIDENSSSAEENGDLDELSTFEERVNSRGVEVSANRKALLDVTAEYQNAPILVSASKKPLVRGSLESVNSESYFGMQKNSYLSLENEYPDGRDFTVRDKENLSLPVNGNRVRKADRSLRNRSSKPQTSRKTNDRNRSRGDLDKGCKPTNIISNITSFIPLVQQKQQAPAPLKGKKEIKVKALEAAEAAKRLEEKKQGEREMRKAAVKIERERLERENIRQLELKQKQKEEERKKKEADMAARKRLREEEERKGKEKKRRCIEETRKQQRGQENKLHTEKVEKEHQRKTSGENEKQRRDLVEEAKQQLKSKQGGEVAAFQKEEHQPSTTDAVAGDAREESNIPEALDDSKKSNGCKKVASTFDGLQGTIEKRISIPKDCQVLLSYEISPYKESDDEDGEEEHRREKKQIPFWARRECLDQIILSKQHLDPNDIFGRKSSFNLSEVLTTRVIRKQF